MSLIVEQHQTNAQTIDSTTEPNMDPLLKTFCSNIDEINAQNMVSTYSNIYICVYSVDGLLCIEP